MARFSGKDGTATSGGSPIVSLDRWNVETETDVHAHHDNQCAGNAEEQVTGVSRWRGSYNTGNPGETDGETISLVLYDDQNVRTGTAVITNVAEECNRDGTPVGFVTSFVGHGALVTTSGSAA